MTYEEAISELENIKRVYANMRKEYQPCVESLQIAVDLLKQAKMEEDRLREQCRAFIDMVEMVKGESDDD